MICKENDVVSIFNLLFINAVPPRQIQVYQTHCIIKIENPQQEDSAVGSLSLFGFQQSIYASVSAFLKRFTSDLLQTLFSEASKSRKPLKYKVFRGFGIIPTRS